MKKYKYQARDDELGGVDDFLFKEIDWGVRFVVLNTGNWLAGRKVLIAPSAIEAADGSRQVMKLDLTRKQIEDGPSVDSAKPISQKMEDSVMQHFGWPSMMYAPLRASIGSGAPPLDVPPQGKDSESRQLATRIEENETVLRSVNEVAGYHIRATDGDIGHADDFVIEDQSWAIRYLVVATHNWLPGKKVLVSPTWVLNVSWAGREVVVDLDVEAIKDSPRFDPEMPVNRRYEEQLYDFYGRPVYWE
jgi:hypothetical protein